MKLLLILPYIIFANLLFAQNYIGYNPEFDGEYSGLNENSEQVTFKISKSTDANTLANVTYVLPNSTIIGDYHYVSEVDEEFVSLTINDEKVDYPAFFKIIDGERKLVVSYYGDEYEFTKIKAPKVLNLEIKNNIIPNDLKDYNFDDFNGQCFESSDYELLQLELSGETWFGRYYVNADGDEIEIPFIATDVRSDNLMYITQWLYDYIDDSYMFSNESSNYIEMHLEQKVVVYNDVQFNKVDCNSY